MSRSPRQPSPFLALTGFTLAALALLASVERGGAQEDAAPRDVPWTETGIRVPVFPDPIVSVHFDEPLRPWDGFGVNYVETAQTRDYDHWSQDYGGFGILGQVERDEILDLIFGPDGLRPAMTKMFLDPWHEGLTAADNDNDDPRHLDMSRFDHRTTTEWMRTFNREGLRRVRAWGGELRVLTTLYGPPPWMTRQQFVLGPNLAEGMELELAEYLLSWVVYLRQTEALPVEFVSFHNEGDAYYRWPRDGSNPGEDHRDYNLLWPPEQVVEMLKTTRELFDVHGLQGVGLTPGETQNWARFDEWGYAAAIARDPEALRDLALITSHSFAFWDEPKSVYYGDWRSSGVDLLRERKGGGLHAWVTSMSWGDMDAQLVDDIRRNIYMVKVNGVIPWAVVQRPSQWVGGDPNPTTAIRVNEDGTYTVLPGYFFYKQVTRAGQPGTAVAQVSSKDPALGVIAFASAGSGHPDAFVLINVEDEAKDAVVHVRGTSSTRFVTHRSSETERFAAVGELAVEDGTLRYTAPAGSVTTFLARQARALTESPAYFGTTSDGR